jgi:hypothetical protein
VPALVRRSSAALIPTAIAASADGAGGAERVTTVLRYPFRARMLMPGRRLRTEMA